MLVSCSAHGHATQQAEWKVSHPICLGSRRLDDYSAPELPNAQTPVFLGQGSMKKLRTLILTFTRNMYLVGRGYELRLSPGSEMHRRERGLTPHAAVLAFWRRAAGAAQ